MDFEGGPMIDAFFNALSGLRTSSKRLQNSANNVANIQTPGFKKNELNLAENRTGGVSVVSSNRVNTPGSVLTTSNPIDIAIQGNGLFQVTLPNGGTGFTRSGSFKIDGQGRLSDSNGNPLQPEITVPAGSTELAIGAGGEVSARVGGEVRSLGQFQLSQFNNPGGLDSAGNNLLLETAASGQAVSGSPGTGSLGSLVSGAVESSNVDLSEELVGQLVDKTVFQANINVIRVAEDMTGTLLDLES